MNIIAEILWGFSGPPWLFQVQDPNVMRVNGDKDYLFNLIRLQHKMYPSNQPRKHPPKQPKTRKRSPLGNPKCVRDRIFGKSQQIFSSESKM